MKWSLASQPVEELFLSWGPISSAAVRVAVILDIKEDEGEMQQEEQVDGRDEEEGDEMNGEFEEIRSNAHRAHETWR